ncbi:MAG: riboflavin biosynthesis protein RibF [Verrucomicrobia bacterium]|nr:riboflavin biosynthesis protein RibF [Verrucomicrobiota bacterium]
MQIVHTLNECPPCPHPTALTIGFFDGVHRGHQQLFSHLCNKGFPVCLTFENHPLSLLHPEKMRPLLTTNEQRYELMEQAGVKLIIALKFDPSFADQEPCAFLHTLRSAIPFDVLLLGKDAHLGKGRSGSPAHLYPLAQEMGFTLEYLNTVEFNGVKVSSSRIRDAIESGKLDLAKALLGRPLSYRGTVVRGTGLGKRIGYHTANLKLPGLCLPPDGVYAAMCGNYRAVANLGVAPTFHIRRERLLEVHLLDTDVSLYDREIEVVLHSYLRAERKFSSPEALRAQIVKDINEARELLP